MEDAAADVVAPSSPAAEDEGFKRPASTAQVVRADVDAPLNRMHELLQERWPQYQQIVTDFLLGRLNRDEFEVQLRPMRVRGFIRLHNEVIMALLSNAYRDCPPPAVAVSVGWSKKRRVTLDAGDPAARRLKQEVMGLTNRERARVKAVGTSTGSGGAGAGATGQPNRPRPNSMIETRFAKLPRVPMSAQKINSSQHHNDIIKGFHVPLLTETLQLPEQESLKDRVIATALENGLLGGVAPTVPALLLAGLEIHLRNVLGQVVTRTQVSGKYPRLTTTSRPSSAEIEPTVRPEALSRVVEAAPFVFGDAVHTMLRMQALAEDPVARVPAETLVVTDLQNDSGERVRVARVIDKLLG
ncbi:hypothetical protein PYCC9005_004999 [Savitreella phatthalungensis]